MEQSSSSKRATLSVLITYRNEKELLTECLNSLLNGTDPPDEILISDDASESPAARHLPEGCNARIIRFDAAKGAPFCRNALVSESRCDYVHLHDADDLFHSDWCRRVRSAIEEGRPDAVFTEMCLFSEKGILKDRVVKLRLVSEGKDLTLFAIDNGFYTINSTIRKTAFLRVNGYNEEFSHCQDYEFHVRLAASGITYKILNESLVMKRQRPNSLSSNQAAVWVAGVKALGMFRETLPELYRPHLSNIAARTGRALCLIGAFEEGKKAFRLSNEIGPPSLVGQPALYRLSVRIFSLEGAERLSALYRGLFPEAIRAFLRRWK